MAIIEKGKMNIIDKVKKNIEENCLLEENDRVLAAVSGGSDSAAMLDILYKLSKKMNFTLYAAHVNHNLREEAAKDEEFVVKLCESLKIKCFVENADVKLYAARNNMSSELAGRKIRYDFFERIMAENSINKLATAHNKNDSAESILLHLTRGCGVDGLCGIPVIRDGYIIRPIIDITKKEIEEYCRQNDVEYVVDKTNFETDYTRNKIRLLLLPLIEENINASFVSTVTSNARIFEETKDFMNIYSEKVYERACKNNKADIKELRKEHVAVIKAVIQKMYERKSGKSENLSQKYVDEIFKHIKNGGRKTVNLPGGISAVTERDTLFFEKTKKETIVYDYYVRVGEKIYIKEANLSILLEKETKKEKNTKEKIYFYAENDSEFHIRNKRNGDALYPTGMTGRKNISDLYNERKLPHSEREVKPILCFGEKVVWVVSLRQDRRFCEGKILFSARIFEGE